MSGIANKIEDKVQQTFHIGEPGSTGREVFEDGTPLVPAGQGHHGTSSGPHITSGSEHVGPNPSTSATTGHNPTTVTGGGVGTGLTGGHHGHEHHHHHHTEQSGGQYGQQGLPGSGLGNGSGMTTGGLPGSGLGNGSGMSSATHHHEHHSHEHGDGTRGTGVDSSSTHHVHPATGGTQASGTGFNAGGNHVDRVGALDQNAAMLERTGADGPATSGAAGTDRFDTDKLRDNLPRSETGHTHGTGATRDPVHPTQHGEDGTDTTKEKSGGLMGVLGTSDHDFTRNRSHIGGTGGAYADADGAFKGNTTGPAGNTALTGREGSSELNPVANDQSTVPGTRSTGATDTTSGASHEATHETGEKKSFMQKVKDAIA